MREMMRRAELKHYEMPEGEDREKHWNSFLEELLAIGEKKEWPESLNEIPAVFVDENGQVGRFPFSVLLYDDDDLKCIFSYDTEEKAKKSMKNWEENGMADRYKWKESTPT
jgi:hypothetical protein